MRNLVRRRPNVGSAGSLDTRGRTPSMTAQQPSVAVAKGRSFPWFQRRRSRRDSNAIAYLFILPQVIGFMVFGFLPLLANLVLVFFDWDILTPPRYLG